MEEKTMFIVGAFFLLALALPMATLGRGRGGATWAGAWLCLFLCGLADSLSPRFPLLEPLVPILGTAFAALLYLGVVRFTRRDQRFVHKLVLAAILVSAVRVVTEPFLSDGQSQIVGSAVIVAAVIASCGTLLFSRGRDHTLWERGLALVLPSLAFASAYYAWRKYTGEHALPAIFGWLLTGLVVCSLKTGAFIALATARIEQARREASLSQAAQSDLEARYRELTEAANDLIAELDGQGFILYANPAHAVVIGRKPESLVGRHASTLAYASPEESLVLSDRVDEAQQFTFLAHHAGGHPVTLESNFSRFTDSSGAERIVVTSRDVTARVADEREREAVRKGLEALVESRTEELRSSVHELQESQRLASLGTMAAGIAHQINNPIGSIQMAAEFALATSEDASDREQSWRDALENAVEQARRCGRIVASMLQFARNEPTPKRPEDLAAILGRACDLTVRYAKSRDVELDRSGIATLLPVQGSAIELEQAFLNILRNACEASDGPHVVSIAAARSGHYATVRIRDDGRGMSSHEVDRVLDPFFTTRLDVGGTGLGLSVAHGIIVDHEGVLAIESAPGVGTTITVTLPIREDGAVASD